MSSPDARVAGGSSGKYCFADFTLDLHGGFLLRRGEEVTLRPKSFHVLAYLVEHHGRIVSKAALVDAVWEGAAITDNSLAQCLVEIRRALDDDSQQMIRTVARRGYMFTAPVTSPILEFPHPPEVSPRPAPTPYWGLGNRRFILGACILALVSAGGFLWRATLRTSKPGLHYTQITSFTDSAVAPALSPDGRMVAFIRGDRWFLTPDQIYVKMLPDGEPIQVTNDPRVKCAPAFSPDGSRIAYTVGTSWDTYTVSLPGGEPKLLLANASGLTWLDKSRLLFSEIRTGTHMGIVTATQNRSEYRKIYFPRNERAMAHFSYPSPDRKWVLVVEMDPVWQPCRVVPMDGSSSGWQAGPKGSCTSAAWSPDGKWMYVGVNVNGANHLWRQRFPKGEPEQITFGPTEEEGIAVAPDGRSLITSVGLRQGAVWIHRNREEQPLASDGYTYPAVESSLYCARPRFSRDGQLLFYLNRATPEAPIELRRADLRSGRAETVASGLSILEFDLSVDGKEVVFSAQPSGKPVQLWLASLDRSSPPRLVASSGETSPHFGPDGEILYRLSDGTTHWAARIGRDGSEPARISDHPIGNIQTISPDRRWIVAISPVPDGGRAGSIAVPIDGGSPRRICVTACQQISWAPDGRFLYIGFERPSRSGPGKTVAIPVPPGEIFPNLPASGIQGLKDASSLPGARIIDGFEISPGPDPSVFAYVKSTIHRNLFRIPLQPD